ncbi:MAG: GNAT family N-acetyltransferase [Ignavibacterium sp.]|nr:GNAT family N-acetyltransferase [Ignavibacterium sp.]MDW8375567.1 GNAT family N-acetyltransferase [Ignavibacteriales bacterium]
MKISYSNLKSEYLDSLVKIHRETFKDHFNSRLGNFYTREYLKWLNNKNEFDSFILCAVDEEEKRVIGYICGARLGFQTKMNRDLLFPTVISFLTKPYLFFDKRFFLFLAPKFRTLIGKDEYKQIKNYESNLKQPIYSVISFGIDSNYKSGMNLGFLILEDLYKKFFEELKKRNVGTVRATIRKNNNNIIKYYQMKKWTLSPIEGDSQTIFFYKEIN